MKRSLLILMLAAAAVLGSCTKWTQHEEKVTVTYESRELSADGGSMFLSIVTESAWVIEIEEGAEWASVSLSSGFGTKHNVILSYAANPGTLPRQLRLAVRTSFGSRTPVELTQAGRTQAGVGGAGPGEATARPRWLELPATSATDGLDFFARSCSIGGKALRNYAFYWDYTNRVSHWVAYPLCSVYLGSSGRSEAWGYDPYLPASKQSNVSGGFKEGDNGWYARGHQLPSADRTANEIINATTFYGTNITPQNNDFNGGVWATLESRVRAWANSSDTLYVVTGCVTDGATHYVYDRSNNKVTVPTAYYKAVLRYRKDATIGRKGYMAAAFWYDHEGFPQVFSKNESLSVAALEEKLGYELFVNLSNVVGTADASTIKSEKPSTVNWWWQ